MAGTACARLPKPSERHDMVPEYVAVRDACNAIPNVADQDACTDKTRAVHPKFLAPDICALPTPCQSLIREIGNTNFDKYRPAGFHHVENAL